MGFSFVYGISFSFYFKENSFNLLYIFFDIGVVSPFITTFIGEVFNRFIFFLKGRKSSSRLKLTKRAIRIYDNKLNKLMTLYIFKLTIN
jgi:hypothetical protein